MHATDPAYLARRIGRPASEGCVRVPADMNRFMDRHGVLDADYQQMATYDAAYRAILSDKCRPDAARRRRAGGDQLLERAAHPHPVVEAALRTRRGPDPTTDARRALSNDRNCFIADVDPARDASAPTERTPWCKSQTPRDIHVCVRPDFGVPPAATQGHDGLPSAE